MPEDEIRLILEKHAIGSLEANCDVDEEFVIYGEMFDAILKDIWGYINENYVVKHIHEDL